MNGPDGSRSHPQDVGSGNLSRLFHRLVDLMELQAELLKVDTRDAVKALTAPTMLIAGGIVFGFGSVFLLLLAFAAALTEWAGFSQTVALLIAGIVGLLISGGAALAGWHLMQRSFATFDRSRMELRTNLAWLKATLKHPTYQKHHHKPIKHT